MRIFVNDRLCRPEEAVVSVYDHGFLYGIGLFETFRTYGGSPFLLDEHLRRLEAGCEDLAIVYKPDAERIRERVRRLLEANGLPDGYFRLTVTAGTGELGLPSAAYDKPTELLYVKPLPASPAGTAGKPLQLLRLRRNTPEGDRRLKSLHYMNNILAKRELSNYPWAGNAEGLFLDEKGFVAEGIVSNVFFVRDGVCYTPSLETGILPGVTRGFVLRLLRQMNIPCAEGLYRFADLLAADEVFLTNSIQEIVPVHALFDPSGQKAAVGGGQAGPLTVRLQKLYRQACEECREG